MKVLVTGGLGQIRSHVVEMLMARGDEVVAIDNLATGRREHLSEHPNVEDVARTNVLALQAAAGNRFYNIGTGVKTSIRELIEALVKATGSSLIPRFESYPANDTRQPAGTGVGSTVAARRDMHFEYSFSVSEGLRRLIEWRRGAGK